ncbi:NAD(P)/FAD-dependent oxidoreductase, partial [Patulibacter sp. S7RM1-6]
MPDAPVPPPPSRHRVVIVGSGFGGLFAAKALDDADVDVTIVDRTNHHLFQPLLYQVATGILSEGDIAPPTRDILRHQENATVVLGDVTDVDTDAREVVVDTFGHEARLPYDSLVVATGAQQSYFGHDEFALDAPGLKTIDDALELRGRIFGAFEMAERSKDPVARRAWTTFVVVGGGPTGVEMAGQIAELSHRSLGRNFRRIDPDEARVVLLDGGDTLLHPFPKRLQRSAAKTLRGLGVEIHQRTHVTGVDETGVDTDSDDPALRRIQARTKFWAAGVEASPLGRRLVAGTDAQVDRSGRVLVAPDCTVPGRPEVFVVGDLMKLGDLPGVAEVAMQSGRHAAETIRRRLAGDHAPRPLRYRDLGSMAAISRFSAVATVGPLKATGFVGWVMWLFVHLMFLTGFKNRISVLYSWIIAFVGRGRPQRTITAQQVLARKALRDQAREELARRGAAAPGPGP